MSPARLDRRDLLKTTARAVTLGALGVPLVTACAAQDKHITLTDAIPARTFGKTGVKLPILAYGGAALPKVWGNTLSTEDRVKLVRYAYDSGIRYFDTAGNYMESQPILGEALEGIRNNVYLVSKVETTSARLVRPSVEKALTELKTDHLDAVLIHGTPGIEQMTVPQAMRVHTELVRLRDEEIIRHIGLSAHGYFDKALALISTGGFDLCMLAYGYIPRGHNQVFSDRMIELREACLAKAHELAMGVAAIKVLAAGVLGAWAPYIIGDFDKQRISRLPAAAIRYVLQDRRIHVLTIGMRLTTDIDANIKTLAGDATCTDEDKDLLAEFSARAMARDPLKSMRME